MRSRTIAVVISLALITVSTGLMWDCGCAFAEILPQDEAPTSVTTSCHQSTSQKATQRGEHEDCCMGCRLESYVRTPSLESALPSSSSGTRLKVFFTKYASFRKVSSDEVFHLIYRLAVDHYGSSLSTSVAPLYITNQALLI